MDLFHQCKHALLTGCVALFCAVLCAYPIFADAAACPSIAPFHADIGQVFNGFREDYKWTFALSSPINEPPPGASKCERAAYISQYTEMGGCASTIGEKREPTVTNNGCIYSYSDATGEKRAATVDLACDSGANTVKLENSVIVTVVDDNTYSYAFKGTFAGVCGGGGGGDDDGPKGSGGCGGGCVFVIIFFVGAALYVAGTVAFNYFKLNKRGKELAPHPEFWLLIPGLLKDGAIFSFQMATKPCRKDEAGSTYTQV